MPPASDPGAWALDEASRLCPGADADVWRGHPCWLVLAGRPGREPVTRKLADVDAEPDEASVRAAVRQILREDGERLNG